MKKFGFVLMIILGLLAAWYILIFKGTIGGTTMDTINFIENHMNATGKIVDIQREIMVNSIEDVRWYSNKKGYEIKFGKLTLKFTTEEFISDEYVKALKRIGFEIKKDRKTGELLLFYNGEKVTKYVK